MTALMTKIDTGANKLVPPEAPLAMPTQNLSRWRGPRARLSGPASTFARIFVFTAAAATTGYATWEMFNVVGQETATTLQIALVILFGLTFLWIALAAATASLGFLAIVWRKGRPKMPQKFRGLSGRTAVVLPIYHEEITSTFGTIQTMATALIRAGQAEHFDFFVLSDSKDPETMGREYEAAKQLRSQLGGSISLYYRQRMNNEGRKAGNIADFVRRWGAAYDFMIVLDADSYMSAQAMIALVMAMEEDLQAGLIQTAPRLYGGSTLFARVQQFATATYGPVLAAGLASWQGKEGNYWGHNAIIRVKAFANACGLPDLAGRRPFGGHIMSHDFVEAALLRRAGFSVYMRPDIDGSYEGTPPTLAEHAARDRRWAQGNLQHAKVVPAASLHWISRFHLMNGIMSYLASPLWLLFLVAGLILSWEATTIPPDYFPEDFSLFPSWPRFDAQRAYALLGFSVLVLLAPKILAVSAILMDRSKRLGAGGILPVIHSALWETLLSALLAPILMLMQTRFVTEILLGRDAGWVPQQRHGRRAEFSPVFRRHWGHTAAGVLLSIGTFSISLQVWLWLIPVWLGLVLAIPIALLTSSRDAGGVARRLCLFLVPEEAAEDRDD